MSISTTENASSARALDRANAYTDRWHTERLQAEEEIRALFALIGTVPVKGIALPKLCFSTSTSPSSEGVQSMHDNICYGISDDKPMAALVAVLEKSQCPLVAKLRKVLEDEYVKDWADDLADYRAGD